MTKEVTGDIEGAACGRRASPSTTTAPSPDSGVRDALDGSFDLAAGETRTFTDVQVGTACTVTEVDTPPPLPGYVFDPPVFIPSDTITVDTSGQSVDRASLRTRCARCSAPSRSPRTVTGDTAGQRPGSTEFDFALDCDDDTFDTTFTLAAGETFTSDPIRVGRRVHRHRDRRAGPGSGVRLRRSGPHPRARRRSRSPTRTRSSRVDVEQPRSSRTSDEFEVTQGVTGDTDGYVQDTDLRVHPRLRPATPSTPRSTPARTGSTRAPRCRSAPPAAVDETTVPDPATGFTWSDPGLHPRPASGHRHRRRPNCHAPRRERAEGPCVGLTSYRKRARNSRQRGRQRPSQHRRSAEVARGARKRPSPPRRRLDRRQPASASHSAAQRPRAASVGRAGLPDHRKESSVWTSAMRRIACLRWLVGLGLQADGARRRPDEPDPRTPARACRPSTSTGCFSPRSPVVAGASHLTPLSPRWGRGVAPLPQRAPYDASANSRIEAACSPNLFPQVNPCFVGRAGLEPATQGL